MSDDENPYQSPRTESHQQPDPEILWQTRYTQYKRDMLEFAGIGVFLGMMQWMLGGMLSLESLFRWLPPVLIACGIGSLICGMLCFFRAYVGIAGAAVVNLILAGALLLTGIQILFDDFPSPGYLVMMSALLPAGYAWQTPRLLQGWREFHRYDGK